MKAKLLSVTTMALTLAAASSGWAGDNVEAGKTTFEASCADCHFEDDFVGETKEDIAALISGVVSGETEHKGEVPELTEADIAALAAFFASAE